MRILIHDYAGHGFTLELARELAERGSEVLYLHGGGLRASRASMEPRPGDPATLRIQPVGIREPLVSRAGPRRLLQERRYGVRLGSHIIADRPDVVLSIPSSLDAQKAAQRAAREVGAGFVYWIQDVYSAAIQQLLGPRFGGAGRLIAAPFARLERRLFRTADSVIAISPDFLPMLDTWGVPSDRIAVIPNWAPLDEIRPLPRHNAWSAEHDLDGRPVLLYSGTLGRKHDPELLLALARGLPDANVVVVSEGAGTGRLGRADISQVPNLVTLPIQPAARVSEVLASADILVAILDPEATVFSVPSKVLTYLAAGRPILAAIPEGNLAARTVRDAGAGVTVDPSDAPGFVAAARAMFADRTGRDAAGAAGRAHAEAAFAIRGIADSFEEVLRRAADVRTRRGVATDTASAPDHARPEAKA
ncbi:MAG: glycosyltransferase family 4 protein [Candidatus Limnocylindria bacterium]